jgi:hypothetical protein
MEFGKSQGGKYRWKQKAERERERESASLTYADLGEWRNQATLGRGMGGSPAR